MSRTSMYPSMPASRCVGFQTNPMSSTVRWIKAIPLSPVILPCPMRFRFDTTTSDLQVMRLCNQMLQSLFSRFPTRHDLTQQFVERPAMISDFQMTEFVRYDVIDARYRGKDQIEIEQQSSLSRAAPPPLSHPADCQ